MYQHFIILLYVSITLVEGAVYTIQSTKSNLYLCAEAITESSIITLQSDSQIQDALGNYLCYWSFDSTGYIYFSGTGGTLVIEASVDDSAIEDCSTQTFKLNTHIVGNNYQLFGWVNSVYGQTIRTSEGNGMCNMDVQLQSSGQQVLSGAGGTSDSQSFKTSNLFCPSGYFWNQDPSSPICSPCPIGSYCIGQLADKVVCPAGTYSLSSGRSVCSSCERGFYCTGGANKVACPAANFNTVVGATSSAACDAPHSIQAVNSNLFVCAATSTQFSVMSLSSDPFAGLSTCWWYETSGRLYLSGSGGLLMDSVDSTTCLNSAFILNTDTGSSATQTFGWVRNSAHMLVNGGGSGVCAMDNGNQPVGGSVFASARSSGSSSQSYKYRSFTCLAGSFWNQDLNSPSCLPCPIGSFCPGGNSNATLCPAGSYTLIESSWSCSVCEPGYYCTGGDNRTPCPAGTASSHEGLTTVSGCMNCMAGYFCDAGAIRETASCAPGTYSFTMGSSTSSGCKVCDAGYYCPGGNNRILCDPGYYCDAGTSLESSLCPPGKYSLSYGTKSVNDCILCEGGYYCSGGSSRSLCTEGYYCESGTSVQTTRCPSGTYSLVVGLTSATDCTQCEPGFYCSGGRNHQICPAGYYCEAQTGVVSSRCPPGTYSNSTGLKSADECSKCDSGYYCTGGSNRNLCEAGYYCVEGTSTLTTRCTPGKYSIIAGLKSVDECTTCEAGYYCSGGRSRNQCDPGYYCVNGTAVQTTLCPTGTYSLLFGLTSIAGCVPCEAGFACSGGSNRFQCPTGSTSSGSSSFCLNTRTPTGSPTGIPSAAPTKIPTANPSFAPTGQPTSKPSPQPSSSRPVKGPVQKPTQKPSFATLAVSIESSSKPETVDIWWVIPVTVILCFCCCLVCYYCSRRLRPNRKLRELAIQEPSFLETTMVSPDDGDPIESGFDGMRDNPTLEEVSTKRASGGRLYFV